MTNKEQLDTAKQLKKKLEKYAETAEQHEFVKLMMIDIELNKTINHLEEDPNYTLSENEFQSMIRVITKIIGERLKCQ